MYGTYGLCTQDRSRYCNKYLFESADQCLRYRSEFDNTVNFIVNDHSISNENWPETNVNVAKHMNLINLVKSDNF